MSTYKGRVALVTGASSGIGAAIAEDLVKAGLIVVGAARRLDMIQALSERLKGQPGRLIAKKLDISKENEIEEIFKTIEKELGGVDVLVNNAAVMLHKPIHLHTTDEIKFVTDVNHVGVVLAAREAIKGMIRRNVGDGYIVNINSVIGHQIPFVPGVSIGTYAATKFAMTATCEALRHDMKNAGLKIRVTSISPGAVKTSMTDDFSALLGDCILKPEEVAQTVTFVLSMPKSAEITELTIHPTGETF